MEESVFHRIQEDGDWCSLLNNQHDESDFDYRLEDGEIGNSDDEEFIQEYAQYDDEVASLGKFSGWNDRQN